MSSFKIPIDLPDKLRPFMEKHKRFKVAYGGRSAGKSQGFADMLLALSLRDGVKVGCFREYMASINDSVHALLQSEIDRLGLPGYSVGKAEISNSAGGMFRFKGLSRDPHSIKSMAGFKYFWVEESQSISSESLKLLTPTLREDEGEIWFSMNPMSSADPMSQRFIEPFINILNRDGYYEDDLHLIIKMNYTDNPWMPNALEQERLFDLEHLSRAEYEHIWLGSYCDTVEGSIIPSEWFTAAIDAHEKLGYQPQGIKVCSFDPSDQGHYSDDKGLVIRHGSVITHADFKSSGDAADGMDWALNTALDHQADLFTWDCDGLGVALKRQVTQALTGKYIAWSMFKGSEGVDRPNAIYDLLGPEKGSEQKRTNLQTFKNKRAQYYGDLRDRFFSTYQAITKGRYLDPGKMISVSSEIPCIVQLRSEICRIPKKHNAMGYFQIMSKEEMKRLKIKSPNLADSTMMSLRVPPSQMQKASGLPVMPVHTPVIATPSMGF